jgi:hypothetical protein
MKVVRLIDFIGTGKYLSDYFPNQNGLKCDILSPLRLSLL